MRLISRYCPIVIKALGDSMIIEWKQGVRFGVVLVWKEDNSSEVKVEFALQPILMYNNSPNRRRWIRFPHASVMACEDCSELRAVTQRPIALHSAYYNQTWRRKGW